MKIMIRTMFVYFGWGQHPVMLRAFSSLCAQESDWQSQRTLWDARN